MYAGFMQNSMALSKFEIIHCHCAIKCKKFEKFFWLTLEQEVANNKFVIFVVYIRPFDSPSAPKYSLARRAVLGSLWKNHGKPSENPTGKTQRGRHYL